MKSRWESQDTLKKRKAGPSIKRIVPTLVKKWVS